MTDKRTIVQFQYDGMWRDESGTIWVNLDTLMGAMAGAWNLALDHVWELNDPIDSLTGDGCILPVVTEADIYQARRENPYAQED